MSSGKLRVVLCERWGQSRIRYMGLGKCGLDGALGPPRCLYNLPDLLMSLSSPVFLFDNSLALSPALLFSSGFLYAI